MKRSLYHTYQMNLGTSCLLNRTIPKNLSTKWGALQAPQTKPSKTQPLNKFGDPTFIGSSGTRLYQHEKNSLNFL